MLLIQSSHSNDSHVCIQDFHCGQWIAIACIQDIHCGQWIAIAYIQDIQCGQQHALWSMNSL